MTDPRSESRSDQLVKVQEGIDAPAMAAAFASPPVVEVSLAVSFQPLTLRVTDAGPLHAAFQADYPSLEEQPPIPLPIEHLEGLPEAPRFELQMIARPSLPRLWFLNGDGTELVQIQSDWFAHNWRQTEEIKAPYPLYGPMREAFSAELAKFAELVRQLGHGELVPTQAEISYINHIDDPNMGNVIDGFKTIPGLPETDGSNYAVHYSLTVDGRKVGRLHVEANTAFHRITGRKITALNITARGFPLTDGIDGALAFLDFGAVHAVEAFVRSTTPEMHTRWSVT